ncbi:MAG TPA: hypothetical protein VIV40_32695 [Kofleriaceae bacterium]
MRIATLLLAIVVGLAGCNDVRDFAGEWSGARAGTSPAVRVGEGTSATLTIDTVDRHGLRGHLRVVGTDATAPIIDADFQSLEAAEADALATMTFSGAPMRVYLAFVATADGDALAMIALYDSHRIEVRLLRGGAAPLYAIYALAEGS